MGDRNVPGKAPSPPHYIRLLTCTLPLQLHRCLFTWEQKVIDPGTVKNVAARHHEIPLEDQPSFSAWLKALFDQNSDGIEDTILRCLAKKQSSEMC